MGLRIIQQREPTVLHSFVVSMAGILRLNDNDLEALIYQILALNDEKEQTTRFRKVLEESRKRNAEKGVPLHL